MLSSIPLHRYFWLSGFWKFSKSRAKKWKKWTAKLWGPRARGVLDGFFSDLHMKDTPSHILYGGTFEKWGHAVLCPAIWFLSFGGKTGLMRQRARVAELGFGEYPPRLRKSYAFQRTHSRRRNCTWFKDARVTVMELIEFYVAENAKVARTTYLRQLENNYFFRRSTKLHIQNSSIIPRWTGKRVFFEFY